MRPTASSLSPRRTGLDVPLSLQPGNCPVLLLACHSLTGMAEPIYYSWVDNRGNVINSDRPPPQGLEYEVLDPESELSRSVRADEGAVPLEVLPRPGNEFAARNKSMEERAMLNAKRCKKVQANLQKLERGESLNIRNAQGEIQELSLKQIREQQDIARTQVRIYCN